MKKGLQGLSDCRQLELNSIGKTLRGNSNCGSINSSALWLVLSMEKAFYHSRESIQANG